MTTPKKKNNDLTVPKDLYVKLLDRFDNLETELDTYRQKSPIIGVRWFGAGGMGIGLTHPINSVTKVALDGYGDKAVIDYATWTRIRKCIHCKFGLLVRDDSVIEEMHITGKVAPADREAPGPNSLTQAQTEKLLNGSVVALKKVVKYMDSHWGPIHLIKEAAIQGITDETKLAYLHDRSNELQIRFRWGLLHEHDLRLAAERFKINSWDTLNVPELIEVLADFEIKSGMGR